MGFSYEIFHDKNATAGISINGKNLFNYRPEDVGALINSMPEPMQLMLRGKIQDSIMGDSEYEFDESRRAFHYQPDFTELKKKISEVKTIYLYLHKLDDGNFRLTDTELAYFKMSKEPSVKLTETCPACNGKGVVAADYCSVCWGKELIEKTVNVEVVSCDLEMYNKLKKNNPVKAERTVKEIRAGYPDWTPLKSIIRGTALDWDDIDDMC